MNYLAKNFNKLVLDSIKKANAIKKEIVSFDIYNHSGLDKLHANNVESRLNPPKKKVGPLEGRPFAKGVVLKTLIKKPRKPNSANRKCVLVKLSFGKEMIAYVPGIGHNLQEHQTVLVRGGKLKDVPGVKVKCVRGKYDLPHVRK